MDAHDARVQPMSRTVTIYGIPNCDTMKKAIGWLNAHGIEYDFINYKKAGIDRTTLEAWAAELGWETLLNRRGMMWRKLPDSIKAAIDRDSAIRLMLDTPSMIKRPVLDTGSARHVGFKPEWYATIFSKGADQE